MDLETFLKYLPSSDSKLYYIYIVTKIR